MSFNVCSFVTKIIKLTSCQWFIKLFFFSFYLVWYSFPSLLLPNRFQFFFHCHSFYNSIQNIKIHVVTYIYLYVIILLWLKSEQSFIWEYIQLKICCVYNLIQFIQHQCNQVNLEVYYGVQITTAYKLQSVLETIYSLNK